MRGWLSIVMLLQGCPCAPASCDPTLEVSFEPVDWGQGTWSLRVEGSALDCTIVVPPSGDPTPLDVSCEGRVERAGFLFDTGSFLDPDVFVFRTTLPEAAEEVRIEVVHDDGSTSVPQVFVVPVAWVDTSRWVSTCQVGCAYGLVEINPSTGG